MENLSKEEIHQLAVNYAAEMVGESDPYNLREVFQDSFETGYNAAISNISKTYIASIQTQNPL